MPILSTLLAIRADERHRYRMMERVEPLVSDC